MPTRYASLLQLESALYAPYSEKSSPQPPRPVIRQPGQPLPRPMPGAPRSPRKYQTI